MKQRLLSLDILRGLTVFCMILVNNGGGREHFEMLKHSAWNGLTPCDLVFPFFLFMVGVSIFLAKPTPAKILRRTLTLFAVGVALHAWDAWVWGEEDILATLRITGVLQRIALCYGIVSLTLLYVPIRHLWKIAAALLAVYTLILLAFNGYAPDESNFANVIDRAVFGASHLYRKGPIDPEGLPALIPSVAHTMIGVLFGRIIISKEQPPQSPNISKEQPSQSPNISNDQSFKSPSLSNGQSFNSTNPLNHLNDQSFKSQNLLNHLNETLAWAFVLIFAAYFLSYGLPLNKRIWSPTYVLATCGMAAALLALLTIYIDQHGHQRPFRLFQMFGTNAFGLYAISEMLPSLFGRFGVYNTVWPTLCAIIPSPCWASLAYALFIVAVMSLIAWLLWRHRLFIKI